LQFERHAQGVVAKLVFFHNYVRLTPRPCAAW